MKEEDLHKLVTEAVEKGNVELKATREKLTETEGKLGNSEKALTEANGKLTGTESKLVEAQKTIEQLRNTQSSSGLVKEQPKTLPISEAITVLEGLLPCPAVERSTMGMQRECQEIRAAIHRLKARLA
jgi:chromosome segregation ATPase